MYDEYTPNVNLERKSSQSIDQKEMESSQLSGFEKSGPKIFLFLKSSPIMAHLPIISIGFLAPELISYVDSSGNITVLSTDCIQDC